MRSTREGRRLLGTPTIFEMAKARVPEASSLGEEWVGHTAEILKSAGHRASEPRTAVIEVLSRQGCACSAQEIADALRSERRPVGTATIYRALELLADLGVVQRLDVGEGSARYEPADPSGQHHHHLVCDRCGRLSPFEDPRLERAIERLAVRLDYRVGAHEVILRGACPQCVAAA